MYGLAYVLFERGAAPLDVVLRECLAPFERGSDELFPREKLVFEDATDRLRTLHTASIRVARGDDGALIVEVPEECRFLLREIDRELLAPNRISSFEGRLSDLEPGFDDFVARFADRQYIRDPETGRWGRWLNPLGRWDWWDLGGRFDGVVRGRRPDPSVGDEGLISSGADFGRVLIGRVMSALGGEAGELKASVDANIAPVWALRAAAAAGKAHGLPRSALVLPPGVLPDAHRWVERARTWVPREERLPPGAREFFGLAAEAEFEDFCLAAYERFPMLSAAGIAYHL